MVRFKKPLKDKFKILDYYISLTFYEDSIMKQIIVFIVLTFLFSSTSLLCSCQNNLSILEENNKIVVIFNAVQKYDSIENRFGSYLYNKASINFMSDFFQENQTELDYKGENDTIAIDCNENKLVLGIRYFDAEWIYFLLSKGDTAIFSYKDSFPFCTLKNRVSSDYNLNYPYYKRKRFNQSTPQSQYFNSIMNAKFDNSVYFTSRYNEMREEIAYIDSLKLKNKLGNEYAVFNLANTRYSFLSIPRRVIPNYKSLTPLIKVEKGDFERNDLLNNRNYLWFLRTFANESYSKPEIKQYDPRIIFDSIFKSDCFSPKVKTFLLTDYFTNICQNGSVADIQNYFKKYEGAVKDTAMIMFLSRKYNISETDKKIELDDLSFIRVDGQKTTLKAILSQQKGIVVVIDFWASWCGPCRAQMPLIKKLEENFKGQKVCFVYLSIDRDNNQWLKACKAENISDNKMSFLVLPSKTDFLKNIELKTIPRSLIFDKNSLLVCKDAPRPDSPLLVEMIEKYLKE
jgi:thiol-disulfide isomerase/thioredoxin